METFKKDLTRNLTGLRKKAWDRAWELQLPESFKRVSLRPLTEISRSVKTSIDMRTSGTPVVLEWDAAMKNYSLLLQNRVERNIKYEKHCFPLLTEALHEGRFIYVPPKMKMEMEVHVVVSEKTISLPRIQIVLGNEAEGSFLFKHRFQGKKGVSIGLVDILLESNAKCRIEELTQKMDDNLCMQHIRASVRRDASLAHLSAHSGSPLFRQDLSVELLEEGASCDLKGFWELENDERAHTQVLVIHKAPHTQSNQHYKGVVKGRSRSTFEGKIYVHPEAQKTEAYQLNNNLVLDVGAAAYTKPNLEIFADDVKASHGATISELSEEELFYLRARGMPEALAKEALIRGFTHAIRKEFACGI